MPTRPPALLLIGHGSRFGPGVEEFHQFARQVYAALPDRPCAVGFLELAKPTIRQGLETLIEQGARDIIAMPVMLMAAGHMKNDIPAALNALQADYPGVNITYGVELGVQSAMLQAAQDRIAACESAFGADYNRQETLLMIAGRGTSDADANANIAKIARLLWERMGFGWAMVGYAAVAQPSLEAALDKIEGLGFKRAIVFPYVLFTGHLIRQIQTAISAYQDRSPAVEIIQAPYFNDHPGVVRTLLDRLEQVEHGDNAMNCQLCHYKERALAAAHSHGDHHHHHHHHAYR